MAFNKDIRPDQLGKGQRPMQTVQSRMNQGTHSGENEPDLYKGMKQGRLDNAKPAPTEMKTPNSRMKQGGR